MPFTTTIPTPTADLTSTGPIDENALALYGKDIMFADDLKVGSGGDYLTVDHEECVRQAIYRRLLTVPGEFAVRPNYGAGVALYVKKRATRGNLNELKQRITDQLAQDDRVSEISEVLVSSEMRDGATVIRVVVRARVLGNPVAFTYQFD
jgi:phage baseplate assembly protein W